MLKAYIIQVYGRVQGVGFRYYTRKKAVELGINGFVRNMRDGSVYIEAECDGDMLELFVDWCRQGPEWSRVEKVSVQEKPVEGSSGFTIR